MRKEFVWNDIQAGYRERSVFKAKKHCDCFVSIVSKFLLCRVCNNIEINAQSSDLKGRNVQKVAIRACKSALYREDYG